jgi:hypothetical protein
LLFALLLVFGQPYTVWFSLAGNLMLVLLDNTIMIHFNPYECKISGGLEKFNNLFVIFGSYALFYFTDYAPDPDTKEMFAFIYLGALCVMAVTNIGVLSYVASKNIFKRLKRRMIIRKHTLAVQRKVLANINSPPVPKLRYKNPHPFEFYQTVVFM